MVKKNKNIEFNINSKTSEYGSVSTNFYTEDINSASIRIRIKYENEYLNLSEVNMTPRLDLFHSDGSIWIDENLSVPIPSLGLIQYDIPENVIRHKGDIKAKLFLVKGDKSIHVSNFNFKIHDSGVEEAKDVGTYTTNISKAINPDNPRKYAGEIDSKKLYWKYVIE